MHGLLRSVELHSTPPAPLVAGARSATPRSEVTRARAGRGLLRSVELHSTLRASLVAGGGVQRGVAGSGLPPKWHARLRGPLGQIHQILVSLTDAADGAEAEQH
jgi:hypothetical protein